jgi:hypothetical protein
MTSISKNPDNTEKSMKFSCIPCNYHCMRRNDLHKHFGTQKHARMIIQKDVSSDEIHEESGSCVSSCVMVPSSYGCVCGNLYRHTTSLYKHRRSCVEYQSHLLQVCVESESGAETDAFSKQDSDTEIANLLTAFIGEQSKCISNLNTMIEHQGKQLAEVAAKVENSGVTNNVTTINNTNKFNLSFFLNSECKDAMNVMDFVKMLEVTPEDLEHLADVGYVEGVARMMLNGLRKLDVSKRPIHCTDVKRESFYIKDNDVWEKDNMNRDKMHRVVKHVAHRNITALPEWQKENPTHTDYTTRAHEKYLRIVNAAFGGSSMAETDKFRNKIIRKTAPELVTPKKCFETSVTSVDISSQSIK